MMAMVSLSLGELNLLALTLAQKLKLRCFAPRGDA
jgi:hypothetical protein